MTDDGPEPQAAPPRKPRSARTPKPPDDRAAAKVKSTIHLTVEASRRLSVHAAMTGLDRSALVEELIAKHLRRYVVSDRGGATATAPIRLAEGEVDSRLAG
jgi:hypothetical protein